MKVQTSKLKTINQTNMFIGQYLGVGLLKLVRSGRSLNHATTVGGFA